MLFSRRWLSFQVWWDISWKLHKQICNWQAKTWSGISGKNFETKFDKNSKIVKTVTFCAIWTVTWETTVIVKKKLLFSATIKWPRWKLLFEGGGLFCKTCFWVGDYSRGALSRTSGIWNSHRKHGLLWGIVARKANVIGELHFLHKIYSGV